MDLEAGSISASGTAGSANSHLSAWDGPNDPKNPRNWKPRVKLWHIILASLFALYSSLATVMYAPAAGELAEQFGITNSTVETFTISIYILGYVIGPVILSPLSELYGRLIIYRLCSVIYIAFTIGCALSTTTAMFLVFRLICGCAASAPLVIIGGTIADLYVPSERGAAVALSCISPLFGPALGPVIGGFVSRGLGWRWTFWIILIFAGIVTLATFLTMKETFEPVILKHKTTTALRKTYADNLPDIRSTPAQLLGNTMIRPFKIFMLSPVVLTLSLYTSFIYGLNYVLFTTFANVFKGTYHFSVELSGLSYLGLGMGMLASSLFCMFISDKLLKTSTAEREGCPEQRLIPMIWFNLALPVGFFWYGWSASQGTHWIVPMLGTVLIGIGSMMILIPSLSYVVDAFDTEAAASAVAVLAVSRSLFGAFLPLAGPALYQKLGLGWGNSLLGFIALAFSPTPYLLHRYGQTLRTKFPVAL
ncbi:hypothetical protein NLG97_g216 [Lecanicillium saksenae]|uniref:Uncharacterized protein n=1 Tax=Lecanicillium saksenae TaxID=468837 RepID=A0ACC1R9T7_9HYPO|nr:hypothetical protein NLG97_g216 [Lecanicillium saksenae]